MSDGKWAARIGDDHFCPAHGGIPFVGPGEPTVLIGGRKAARLTDLGHCPGAAGWDAIGGGAFTTLIGKLPAARQTDPTVHGGKVAGGEPTVLIGDTPAGVSVFRRRNVFFIVNPDTKRITMVGVQEYYGSGATQAYVDKATKCINDTWSGPTTIRGEDYQVDCLITGVGRCPETPGNPMANDIEVVETTDPPWVTSQKDPSFQKQAHGHQHSTDADSGHLTPAHEFGHSVGLDDEYKEGPRNPDGTRNLTRTGPPGGLMGHVEPGSRPTSQNMEQLITGKGL
jgi:uncharacterized Zn-binding protein involved in type VI secretion